MSNRWTRFEVKRSRIEVTRQHDAETINVPNFKLGKKMKNVWSSISDKWSKTEPERSTKCTPSVCFWLEPKNEMT